MRMHRVVSLAVSVALAAGLAAWQLRGTRAPAVVPRAATQLTPTTQSRYAASAQTIFDRRCVPCHACYDSPCQLTLQSFEGLDRGANKATVY
jgi:cytochrome c5